MSTPNRRAKRVACWCGAKAGENCKTRFGERTNKPHANRYREGMMDWHKKKR